jgi:hypothetical protein
MKMGKHLAILAAGAATALTLGVAHAETFTSKSGNSSLSITQEPGNNIKRKVTKTPDGQTVIQESGGSRSVVIQRSGPGAAKDWDDEEMSGMDCPDKPAAKKGSDDLDDDDCIGTESMTAFERRMDENRRALNSDPTDDPKHVGPGFERLRAFKKKVDAMKREHGSSH